MAICVNNLSYFNEYYEQPSLWGNELTSLERERIQKTIEFIPEDVKSILDIGCGDGRIINRLTDNYTCMGIDISKEALQHIKCQKKIGSINNIPLPDRSYNLIICCEVLEHLPFMVYEKAITELVRVSNKYILISVPNNESITDNMITCDYCGCKFHNCRHLRSFNPKNMSELIPDFSLVNLDVILQNQKSYHPIILNIAKKMKLIEPITFPDHGLCPQCGYHLTITDKKTNLDLELAQNTTRKNIYKETMLSIARKIIPTHKSGGWIIALYKRQIGITSGTAK